MQHQLWKSVENSSAPVSACSACPGDYEDPDRTQWQPDESSDEPDDEAGVMADL